jgi:hypothetical protein
MPRGRRYAGCRESVALCSVRHAVYPRREPRVAVLSHPFDACVPPTDAAGKAFSALRSLASPRKPGVCLSRLVACDKLLLFTHRVMSSRPRSPRGSPPAAHRSADGEFIEVSFVVELSHLP